MKFFPRRKRQKSLPRSKSSNQDRQWTIHPHNQKSLPSTTGPTSTTSSPTGKPSNITIYTPPDSDVLHIDDSQHVVGRWLVWHKMALFVCLVAFASLLWGYAGILNQQQKQTADPIVILPTATPDLASRAQMNATAAAVGSDSKLHTGSNESQIKLIETSNAVDSSVTVRDANATATAQQIAASAMDANTAATATIQQAQVNAESTVIASRAVLEQKKLEIESKELDDIHEETSERRENTTQAQGFISMAMSGTGILGLLAALFYLLTNSKPLLTGLSSLKPSFARPTVATMTNSGSKQPTEQRKPRRQPTESLSDSNQPERDTMPAHARQNIDLQTFNLFDYLAKARHLLIAGATEAGKSTLTRQILLKREAMGHQILVIDPVPDNDWLHFDVVGRGSNHDAISNALLSLESRHNSEYAKKTTAQNEGRKHRSPQLTVVIDEIPEVIEDCSGTDKIIQTLIMRGRHSGTNLVVLSQIDTVESLGLKGKNALKTSFTRVLVMLSNGKRQARVTLQDNSRKMYAVPHVDESSRKQTNRQPSNVDKAPVRASRDPIPQENAVVEGDFEPVDDEITFDSEIESQLAILAQHLANGGKLSRRSVCKNTAITQTQYAVIMSALKSKKCIEKTKDGTCLTLAGQRVMDRFHAG